MSNSDTLSPLLLTLEVPADYARIENITDEVVLARLAEWKEATNRVLIEIQEIVRQSSLTVAEESSIIAAACAFSTNDAWVAPESQVTAQHILTNFTPSLPLLTQILSHKIKPFFYLNPHPKLHTTTARSLPRPAGGPNSTHDFYESQVWKSSPGISTLVYWCIQHTLAEWYSTLWPLLIPPTMSLLDDYEARYKLLGIGLVSEMLRTCPGSILKRTGVDSLIHSSLTTCLAHLNDPETPQLVSAALATSLSLTLLTTTPGTSECFDHLSALLGEGVIRGVWLYASDNASTILSSLIALPPILRALKIGNARFLKALISQLTHPLKLAYSPHSAAAADGDAGNPRALQLASVRLIHILIEECEPCMPRWGLTILDAVARCWVSLMDFGDTSTYADLREALRHTCDLLKTSMPAMMEPEYARLLSTDTALFSALLSRGSESGNE